MRVRLVAAAVVSVVLGSGCGPNCEDACRKLYGPSPDCDLPTPGWDNWTDKFIDCRDECEDALKFTGDLGGYDPDQRNTTGASIKLANERQAAAWMDCVDASSCERLSDGYCPID
jgi:hypothetical protein